MTELPSKELLQRQLHKGLEAARQCDDLKVGELGNDTPSGHIAVLVDQIF